MDRNEMIERLNDLIQLDVDAVEAYSQVIKHLEYDDICRRLRDFQDDHQAHIQKLRSLIMQLDGRPIEARPDFKGYLLEGFTMLMSVSGSLGAMEAMKANEVITNRNYGKAVELPWPEGIKSVLIDNYSQEERHLNYINDIITVPRHPLR
ncbi:hypothetical protein GMSM_03820 [Geomonas sp. Red276]